LSSVDAGGFADEGGYQLKPELEVVRDTPALPEDDSLLVLYDEDDVPLGPRDVSRQLTRTARLAALDPDDGIAL
jgi:type IV secretion system protein VirD4